MKILILFCGSFPRARKLGPRRRPLRFLLTDRFPEAANGRGLKASRAVGAAGPRPHRSCSCRSEAKQSARSQQRRYAARSAHSLPLRGGRTLARPLAAIPGRWAAARPSAGKKLPLANRTRTRESASRDFYGELRTVSAALKLANPRRIKAAHRRRWKCSTGHTLYAKDDPYRFTDPDGRQSCTGSNLGHCEGENLTVYQVGEPSAPSAKIAHEMVSNKPADRVSAAHSAMNYFGIKPISGTVDIHYNAQMSRQVYGDIIYVKGQGVLTLGPSAYITWAHLGSTLGHEINVHWNMQMLIFQRNAVDSHERDRWEMEAYMYNIRNANRFGNSPGDIAEFNELYQDYKYDLEHRPDSLDVSLH